MRVYTQFIVNNTVHCEKIKIISLIDVIIINENVKIKKKDEKVGCEKDFVVQVTQLSISVKH